MLVKDKNIFTRYIAYKLFNFEAENRDLSPAVLLHMLLVIDSGLMKSTTRKFNRHRHFEEFETVFVDILDRVLKIKRRVKSVTKEKSEKGLFWLFRESRHILPAKLISISHNNERK